jgi:SAM-dependent methyltransferase
MKFLFSRIGSKIINDYFFPYVMQPGRNMIQSLPLRMLTDQIAEPSWYREWFNSPYYHLLYSERDDKEAAAFIDQLLARIQPQPSDKMLDIGCGKGRHSRMLAAKGYFVTGLDISEESIREARLSENEHLEFFVHDMRRPYRTNYYNYVFNFFTSFGYFNTEREHNNAIRTFSQALIKNGLLVIDYLNVHYVEKRLVPNSETEKNNVHFKVTKWHDEHHFYKRVDIDDKQSQHGHFSFTEKVAKFNLGDFNDMLSFHGLQIQEVFGSYDFQPYDIQESPRLILFARKI